MTLLPPFLPGFTMRPSSLSSSALRSTRAFPLALLAAGLALSGGSFAASTSGVSVGQDAEVTLDLDGGADMRGKFGNFGGVISGPSQPSDSKAPDLTSRLSAIGVDAIRNNDYYDDRGDIEGIFNCGGSKYPSWSGCDASDDSNYNWTATDTLFKGINTGGFDLFLRLGGSWENKSKSHQQKGPADGDEEKAWIAAAKKVGKRYEDYYTYIDIWTEFPGKHFWDRSNDDFNAFFARSYSAIKTAFPDKKVGGPGFGAGVSMQVYNGESKNAARSLLSTLYEKGVAPDWIGWHIFTNDPALPAKVQEAYEDLLAGKGAYTGVSWAGTKFFAKTDLILDAYGPTEDPPTGDPPSDEAMGKIYNGGRGAAILIGEFVALQGTECQRAFYYRAGDGTSAPGSVHPGGSGLFYGDTSATPKPSSYAMKTWNTLRKKYTPVALDVSSGERPLYAALGQDSSNNYLLVVSNPSKVSTTWTAKLPNGKGISDYTHTMATIDDTQDGSEYVSFKTPSAIQIPAQSVQIVKLSK